ncbi:MAG: ATP-binding cassette domain-containing protein [Proteobacteria bacterium]|nr:ATP-binding cassette domain-containing protein [Pseudomonadota bacterium]NIS70404.1 ATP-binding cassette domain-containing protein [Pseudomonadota bacterium]
MLEVKDIHTYYGTSHILFDVSLSVDRGEIVSLLGRNGAGKTTTVRSIMGLTPPESGSVQFHGEEMRGKPPYYIAKKGMGYVPDNRLIFPDLTVRENLMLAIKIPENLDGEPWTVDRIYELFPLLEKLDRNLGGYLSGGEQQMLTVGRTLMGNPDLLLLDEPVEGLAPLVVRDLGEQILKLKDMGETILFSEQNVKFATMVAERAYVIDKGMIRYQGTIEQLREDEEIKQKYLMI